MPLKSGLILILFLFTLQATRIKDVTGDDLILGIRNVKYRHFLRSPQSVKQTSGRVSLSLDKHRAKRSAVFSTGVKVCPQESMSEVTTSHKAYYKLRVCQEAVWEAFRIFLDRVPDTMEYQQWVYACQRDSLCMEDLARNFTSTQEHLDMVASRVNDQEQERVLTSEPGEKCSKSPAELSIMESDSETGAPAVVTQKLEEHIVEFTVTVVDPIYSALLRDPGHPQYEHLTQNPHKQMLHVFDKLPGFKAIQVLGLSETEEATVTYAVVFETDETQGHSEITEEKSIDRVLRSMVVKALQEEFSLPVDLHSLTFKKDVPTTAGLEITTSASQSNGDSDILPGETTTRFTQAFPVNPFTPSRSSGIHLRDQILVEAQTAMGELAESSVLQKEPGVPTLVEVTEKKWSNTNTESAITKGTLIIEGPLRTTTVDYLSKTVQKEVENEIVATAATSGRDSFEVTKASPSTQGEMDFDMTAETSSVEATSPIVVASPAPTEQNAIDVFENAIISPTQAIDVNLSNPTGQTESLDLDTAIDPVEALTVQATIETLHHKVLPVGLATPKAILTSSLPTKLAPTEAAIVRMTPDNLLDDEGKPLRTILPPLGGATDENMHKNTEQSDEMEGSLDNGSGILDEIDEDPKSAGHLTTPSMMASNQGKELVVFFSLRVTNLMFSEDLFNKSSPEYKSLENTFLELLLPYLQSNLTGFKELEILNFRNGSVVVNSKLKLNKPVEYNVTEKVQCVLEDVCNAASERLDMEIDSQSLDVEAADDGDPCKFMACNEFSRCVVNALTAEPECLCHPGFSATDHLPCASLCDLEPEYCLNGGSCEIVAGHGVTCRCPVGKFWHYHGERCSELVSLPVDPLLLVACLVGTLSVVCGVIGILIFINKKCIRTRKTMRLVSPDNSTPEDQKS